MYNENLRNKLVALGIECSNYDRHLAGILMMVAAAYTDGPERLAQVLGAITPINQQMMDETAEFLKMEALDREVRFSGH